LKGLDPKKRYELQNEDTGETTLLTGEKLMSEGVEVAIPEVGGSKLLWIKAR